MAFIFTTTGTQNPVVFDDLGGRTFPHPTVSYDLELEFSRTEINESDDVFAAVSGGHITVVDGNGNPITDQNIADYVTRAEIIDEDSMVSDSDQHIPTQQSVKAYVDTLKSVYDTDDNGIVDKSESVDDGAGNASTAAQVKTSVTHSGITTGNPHNLDAADVGADPAGTAAMIPNYLTWKLIGEYGELSIGVTFDGPTVIQDGGVIKSVAVMHDVESASGTGSVTINVTINGSTIWTTTTPPTILETATSPVVVDTVAGDSRTIPVNGAIKVSFSAKTAYSGEPKDLVVVVKVDNL